MLSTSEVVDLTHRLEECDQTIEELNAEIASTTQEIPTNLNFADIMTKALVPKKHKESVELMVSVKDTYRIVTARREMTDETYEASYFIIQLVGDSDGLY